jgi:predicted transcriptional regulator
VLPSLFLTFPLWLPEAAPVAGGAAGLGVLGWLAWKAGLLQRWMVPVAGLFVRVEPEHAGDHLTRALVLDELVKRRVVSTDELRDRLSLNQGTLLWHLRVLERLEVVRSRRVGRIRVWYRRDAGAPTREELLIEDAPQRTSVLEAITSNPGSSLSEVARATGLAKSSVHRHVATLTTAGIVQMRREALRTCLYRVPN